MSHIEGHVIAEPIPRRQRVCLMTLNALPHATVRIDDRCDAVVGVAQKPSPVLNRSHPRHVQVLPRRTGIAVPPVIADVYKHLSAQLRELANLIRKDRLITDEYPITMSVESKHLSLLTASEPRHTASKFMCEEEQLLKRNILAKWNEVDLVIASHQRTVRPNHHRR